jgi:hypothetical protein
LAEITGMNAHTKPPYRQPERTPVQKLINEAGRLIGLTSSIAGCASAPDADAEAEHLEGAALNMGAAAIERSNQVDQLQFLEVAGNYAMRARLYRDRARELRG